MRSSPPTVASPTTDTDPSRISAGIIAMLPRFHVLVIGPGLGRDLLMQETCVMVIKAAKERKMPIVIDADALQLVQNDPSLVRGYSLAVLTPNVVEFGRLTARLGVDEHVHATQGRAGEPTKVEELARALEGVTIVQKGAKDYISNGSMTLTVDLPGGRKRSGGQGDTLTGCVATFLGWRKAYQDKIWETRGQLDTEQLVGLAAFGGAAITRECSRLAFDKRGRSLQASDLTDEVHTAFLNLFGDEDEPDAGGAKL
jgi:ATP-dependent NAD(P)H-hydrate dehydratase